MSREIEFLASNRRDHRPAFPLDARRTRRDAGYIGARSAGRKRSPTRRNRAPARAGGRYAARVARGSDDRTRGGALRAFARARVLRGRMCRTRVVLTIASRSAAWYNTRGRIGLLHEV